ncbi:hypothetical protein HYDPIDRAFT_28195 [Hydnomerulius pinastri MD-312]|uniref:Uncharacterized protein n=1 Tax=Hydnomerulius pinastri MD-312 TaxID=994086 RepID=A0A0C9VGW4_9AGAM|nr:hypothetical protein HYDPIDRAFT_28195 [Hydnomerulius pinastri MD-312]
MLSGWITARSTRNEGMICAAQLGVMKGFSRPKRPTQLASEGVRNNTETVILVDVEDTHNTSVGQPSVEFHDDEMESSDYESLESAYHSVSSGDLSVETVQVDPDSDSDSDMENAPCENRDDLDIALSISETYRLLDLSKEKSSSGLASLQQFANDVCPGVYVSFTKVNFKVLDDKIVKPLGVYGSKEEIVKFMTTMGSIDDMM